MADFNVNHITGKQGQQGTVLAGITTVSSTGAMRIPSGPTEQRGGRGRGLFGKGNNGSPSNVVNMVEIATTGDAIDFGDITQGTATAGASSSTRGLFMSGQGTPGRLTRMDYVTISSSGGGSEFGDCDIARDWPSGVSNNTRALMLNGRIATNVATNSIEFVTIASTGNASDFGDIRTGRESEFYMGTGASTTRAVIFRGTGTTGAPLAYDIDYLTFASKGNSVQFGEVENLQQRGGGGLSNSTRAVWGGGYSPSAKTNSIQYVTIATTGNSVDFGDITYSGSNGVRGHGTTASSTRGLFAGGQCPADVNSIDYITISTTGNSATFGDLTVVLKNWNLGQVSDCHGGIGD